MQLPAACMLAASACLACSPCKVPSDSQSGHSVHDQDAVVPAMLAWMQELHAAAGCLYACCLSVPRLLTM